jgi:hypothetical protein
MLFNGAAYDEATRRRRASVITDGMPLRLTTLTADPRPGLEKLYEKQLP